MLTQNYGNLKLTVILLFLCSAHGAFSQDVPGRTPRPAPRKTFDLKIEVMAGNPLETVEGAKVIVASEEEGVRFSKEKRTTKEGIASLSKVPQGKIKIQVIARECDTFGDVFTLSQDDQTIKITVKKRNPPAVSTPGIR